MNTGRSAETACRRGYRWGYGTAPFTADSIIDMTKVRSDYIACGYMDFCLCIDGLVAVITQRHGSHPDEESLSLFCDSARASEPGAIVYSVSDAGAGHAIPGRIPCPMKNWKSECPGIRQ